VGYRNRSEPCRQIHLLLRGVYQGLHFTFNTWSPLLIRDSQAGAFLATGILNTGVRSEADAVLALLGDHIINKSIPLRTSAIIGLGFAYAGSHREDILSCYFLSYLMTSLSMEIVALAALAVGLIFVGSENGEAAGVILQTLMEREDRALDEKWTRFLGLGLALLYVGQSRPK
jgi:26S proteasome regulatory subunit N1